MKRLYFLMFLYLEIIMTRVAKINNTTVFRMMNYLHFIPTLYNSYRILILNHSIDINSYTLGYYMFEFVYLLKYHLPVKRTNILWYIYAIISINLFVKTQNVWLVLWNISCRNLLPPVL